MKALINSSPALLISLVLAGVCAAQQPAAPKPGNTPVPAESPRSLKSLPANEKFKSPEGRFTIALPKDTPEFEALAPSKDSPKQTGGTYSWTLKEGVLTVDYGDDPDLTIKTEKDYADMAEGLKAGLIGAGGTVLSERAIKLGEYRGYEIRFEIREKLKGISRIFIVGGRKYALFCLVLPDALELALKAFDSFELTTP